MYWHAPWMPLDHTYDSHVRLASCLSTDEPTISLYQLRPQYFGIGSNGCRKKLDHDWCGQNGTIVPVHSKRYKWKMPDHKSQLLVAPSMHSGRENNKTYNDEKFPKSTKPSKNADATTPESPLHRHWGVFLLFLRKHLNQQINNQNLQLLLPLLSSWFNHTGENTMTPDTM